MPEQRNVLGTDWTGCWDQQLAGVRRLWPGLAGGSGAGVRWFPKARPCWHLQGVVPTWEIRP